MSTDTKHQDEDVADGLSLMHSLSLSAREAACIVVDVRKGIDDPHPHTSAHEAEVQDLTRRLLSCTAL